MASVRLQLSPSFVAPPKVEAPESGWLSGLRWCDPVRAGHDPEEPRKRPTQLAADLNDEPLSRTAAG